MIVTNLMIKVGYNEIEIEVIHYYGHVFSYSLLLFLDDIFLCAQI